MSHINKNLLGILNYRFGTFIMLMVMCLPAFSDQDEIILAPSSNAVSQNPVGQQSLTLKVALDIARKSNPVLIAKRGELDIADGNLKQASIKFQHNPELSVRSGSRRISASSNPPSDSERLSEYEVEVSQEFEVWGQYKARRAVASAVRNTTQASIISLEYEILTMVRHQFYATQVAQSRFELVTEQFNFTQSIMDMFKIQFEAGEISRTDYRQLEIQSADIRVRTLVTKSDLETALNDLKFSLGLPSSTQLTLLGSLIPHEISQLNAEAVVALVIENHPDLNQSEFLLSQRELEAVLVRKEAKPNITGSIFFADENENEEFYGVGISIPLGVFNRGQGSKVAARAATRVAAAEKYAVNNYIRGRALSALNKLRATGESAYYYYTKVLPSVNANLEQLENAFRQGEIDMIELRINQRDLLDAQSDALEHLETYYFWLAEVEGMIGESLFDSKNKINLKFGVIQ